MHSRGNIKFQYASNVFLIETLFVSSTEIKHMYRIYQCQDEESLYRYLSDLQKSGCQIIKHIKIGTKGEDIV